jgi:organic hydroperoxide reductase OsmC/OhrA
MSRVGHGRLSGGRAHPFFLCLSLPTNPTSSAPTGVNPAVVLTLELLNAILACPATTAHSGIAVFFERVPGYSVSMPHEHHYTVRSVWTGNKGSGTSNYKAYARDHEISADRKTAPILGSSDPAFRGDPSRYNPEELLVASLSTCHMLWFLHLCSDAAIVVTDYRDEAAGTMAEASDGGGRFMEVILRPRAAIADPARIAEATALHARAHELCFIARSVNFPVKLQPVVVASIASGSSRA